jgi:hypothetical protein
MTFGHVQRMPCASGNFAHPRRTPNPRKHAMKCSEKPIGVTTSRHGQILDRGSCLELRDEVRPIAPVRYVLPHFMRQTDQLGLIRGPHRSVRPHMPVSTGQRLPTYQNAPYVRRSNQQNISRGRRRTSAAEH